MSRCRLIVDARERNVARHEVEWGAIPYEIRQITVGDYIVTHGDTILAVIERKSFEDYAASFKDGRHDNRQKMIELRAETGCKIIYIVEGPAFPSPNTRFGNIPYSNIESSMFHLMVRDDIMIWRTKDTLDTAKMLARFVRSMDTLVSKQKIRRRETPAAAPHGGHDMVVNATVPTAPAVQDIHALLTARRGKSDPEILRQMWSCFKGISIETADDFARTWTLADIISGRVKAEIENFRYSNGRKLSGKVIKSLTKIDHDTCVRMIAAIPGISRAGAKKLLENASMSNLVSCSIDELSVQTINERGKKLGKSAAEKFYKYFNSTLYDVVQADGSQSRP